MRLRVRYIKTEKIYNKFFINLDYSLTWKSHLSFYKITNSKIWDLTYFISNIRKYTVKMTQEKF